MADELVINIEKAFWPRTVMRSLPPLMRALGDRHGNLVIAAQPAKGVIMVKGAPDMIEAAKPELRAIIEEHFPDAPVPKELKEGGQFEAEAEQEMEVEEAPASVTVAPAVASAAAVARAPASPGPPEPQVIGRKRARAQLASPELIWECIRGKSSFLRKRGGERTHFSAEPGNLMSWHCKKFSGLATTQALDVRAVTQGIKESIELVQTPVKHFRKPTAQVVTSGLSKCPQQGLYRLGREVDARFYRRSLLPLARLKYLKVQQSFKKTKRPIARSRRAPQ